MRPKLYLPGTSFPFRFTPMLPMLCSRPGKIGGKTDVVYCGRTMDRVRAPKGRGFTEYFTLNHGGIKMITVTARAEKRLKDMLETAGTKEALLRIYVAGFG